MDGYKSDGYKSDGDGYKSDGAGYKSDGEHVKRRMGGGGSGRYGSPLRQPSKYEQDRLASRRLQPNGELSKAQMRTGGGSGNDYCGGGGGREMMMPPLGRPIGGGVGGGSGGDTGTSRCSSRGGYRSDPEHEIEIQLQCLGGGGSQHDDSGGSQHSHRGYSLDEEDEDNRGAGNSSGPAAGGGGGGMVALEWQRSEMHQRTLEAAIESRSQSRNGYKSDGSLQESPLHPQASGGKAGGGVEKGFIMGKLRQKA